MPGRDGTGPNGLGSMTGRGLGYCSDSNSDRPFSNRPLNLGQRRRFNRGRRGRGNVITQIEYSERNRFYTKIQ